MKKKSNYLLSIICSLVLLLIITITSCKSTKVAGSSAPAPGAIEIIIPCNTFKSDKEFFRATQSALSQDMSMSRDKALLNTKSRLAGIIESKIKNVVQSYRNEITAGGAQEYTDKFEGEARDITNQSMNDVNVICEKTMKNPDGRYETFIAIEMSKSALSNKAANKVSQSDKLKVAYDEKKFREVFDKEMAQLENETPN